MNHIPDTTNEVNLLGQVITAELKSSMDNITSVLTKQEEKINVMAEQVNTLHVSFEMQKDMFAEMKTDLKETNDKHDKHLDDLYSKMSTCEQDIRTTMETNYMRHEHGTAIQQAISHDCVKTGTAVKDKIEGKITKMTESMPKTYVTHIALGRQVKVIYTLGLIIVALCSYIYTSNNVLLQKEYERVVKAGKTLKEDIANTIKEKSADHLDRLNKLENKIKEHAHLDAHKHKD